MKFTELEFNTHRRVQCVFDAAVRAWVREHHVYKVSQAASEILFELPPTYDAASPVEIQVRELYMSGVSEITGYSPSVHQIERCAK